MAIAMKDKVTTEEFFIQASKIQMMSRLTENLISGGLVLRPLTFWYYKIKGIKCDGD